MKQLKNVLGSFFLAAGILALSCSPGKNEGKVTDFPVHRYKNFTFDRSSPLAQRIRTVPQFMLDFYKKYDKRPDYKAYVPAMEDRQIVEKAIYLLPGSSRRMLEERLLGIYFIKNLNSSALTDWVIGPGGDFFVYMVFNPRCLKESLSGTLTYKENTCFRKNDPAYSISVDCGPGESGFLYLLLHEAAHASDYCRTLSPYVEPDTKTLQKKSADTGRIAAGIWKDHRIPVRDFPLREKISFYGARQGPLIDISQSPLVYKQLSSSSFVSLYSCLDWAEDLAELAAFDHITGSLRRPYIILVRKNGRIIFSLEPLKNGAVQNRLPLLRKLLKGE